MTALENWFDNKPYDKAIIRHASESDYASIRFDDKLRALYPLNHYPELKIPVGAGISGYLKRQPPTLYPAK